MRGDPEAPDSLDPGLFFVDDVYGETAAMNAWAEAFTRALGPRPSFVATVIALDKAKKRADSPLHRP